MIEDAKTDGAVTKTRAIFDKAYDRIDLSGSNDTASARFAGESPTYTEQTEFGYVGLEAPLG